MAAGQDAFAAFIYLEFCKFSCKLTIKMKQRRNLSWLIGELKRRNVFRVVAMYAPGAFVLLEVMDIITPALNLPRRFWTIYLLAGSFFLPVNRLSPKMSLNCHLH